MMTQIEALEILAAHRGSSVVLTTMGAVGLWPKLSDTPLDFAYMPSSMGQGISLGLGLALAKPSLKVFALSGDGSLLMNLGSLITVAQHPASLTIILIDNQLYEVTGGQPTVGAGKIDFAGIAKASGFDRVYTFDDKTTWNAQASSVLNQTGPVFVWLKVQGEKGKQTPSPPRPMQEQIARLQDALNSK
jgi:thiamine pyrophosphate-dependent acetolactate synthase large subunit-like protein